MNKQVFKYTYVIVGIANLVSWQFFDGALNTFTKPLLMPVLMLFLYESFKGSVVLETLLIFGALVFSWLGDLALMFPDKFFLMGVGAFFLAQVLYISAFFRYRETIRSWLNWKTLILIIYGCYLIYRLMPNAGELAIPIAIYGSTLIAMALFATNAQPKNNSSAYLQGAIGALLFVISDSLIAVDRFMVSVGFRDVLIMSTYLIAQYLLVNAAILRVKN
jgi:uncharacterized membrane protein YhhN